MRKTLALGLCTIFVVVPACAGSPDAPMTRAEAVQMSQQELTRRTFAQLADIFWESRVEYLLPPLNPPSLGQATFFTKPQVIAPGICGVYALSVSYTPDKAIADRQQIGDPPSRATFMQMRQRYFFASPLGEADIRSNENLQATQVACSKITTAANFIPAGDNANWYDGVWTAAHFLEASAREAKSGKPLSFALSCRAEDRACGDMRGILAKVSVNAIEYLDSCIDPLDIFAPPTCFVLVVRQDSGEPDLWRIKITGRDAPEAIIMKPERRPIP